MSVEGASQERESRLQILLDKQEIHEALMRYCLGIDRCDLELVLSAFHDDALDNHSGVEERAVDRFKRTVGGRSMWVNHNIGNIFIQVDDSAASSQAYFTAWHRLAHDARTFDWVIAGRYLDRFERRTGSWRIAHRTVVYDCERFDLVSAERPVGHPAATFFDHVVRGERSRDDFSYQLMRF
jgi:SnoaL-like domain